MGLPLPLDQFRFNIVLWLLITAYGASGIGNFIAFIPNYSNEDAKILGYNDKSNYSFRLISSLLFFLLGISQFQYLSLVYLTMGEIYITIIAYLYLTVKKRNYLIETKKKRKEFIERKKEEIGSSK